MKAGGGKAKGSGFERDVCRILTKWITGETHPEAFWRSSNSGAKATVDRRMNRKAKMHGDLVAILPVGEQLMKHVSIECKFYKEGSFMDFFNEGSQLRKWWAQCKMDAEADNKTPILIFKFNRTPIFIASTVYFEDSVLRWWPNRVDKPVHIALLEKFLEISWEDAHSRMESGAWF